jgi:SAM-dependent methyltransferase
MLRKPIKTILNTVPWLTTMGYLVDDFFAGKRMAAGKIDTITGSKHQSLTLEESIDYIQEVFADYKHYGNIEQFYGVGAEVGPGDNAGVALLMRRDGCTRVDLIDRYYSKRNIEQQAKIYAELDKKYSLDTFKAGQQWDEKMLSGIDWKIGQPAEDYFQKLALDQGQIYDFIVSRSVLEHLYNPIAALRYMVDSLKPGGQMIHKVDLRDHGMYSLQHHELTFLEVSTFLYPFLVKNSGRPNRILAHHYYHLLEKMKKDNLIKDYLVLVTQLVNVGDIIPHVTLDKIDENKRKQAINFVEKYRQRFANEFKNIESQYLSISGFFLIIYT